MSLISKSARVLANHKSGYKVTKPKEPLARSTIGMLTSNDCQATRGLRPSRKLRRARQRISLSPATCPRQNFGFEESSARRCTDVAVGPGKIDLG
jgi:hypothetical protein